MFIELIAIFFAGFAAGGIVLMLNYGLGGRLPNWLTPVAAGAAMIGVTVWSEYTWFDRTVETLPEGIEVTASSDIRQMYRPWTYLVPLTDHFVAVDVGTRRSHEAMPDHYLVDIYEFGRWRSLAQYPMLIDCSGSRQGLLPGADAFQPDGTVRGVSWADVPADDPLVTAACKARG